MENIISFEIIDQNNYIEAADCLAYMFFNFEPVTRRLNLEWDSYCRMVNRFCRVIGTNGLCFIALDAVSNKVAGVITSIDMMLDFGEKFANEPEDFYYVLEKLKPDIAITSALEENYLEKMNFLPGECLHLFQCCVLPEYAGKHIASKLVEMTLTAAINSGYKHAAADCTSGVSRRIFDNLNFTEENSITYSEFEYNGSKPFDGIKGEYILMVKDI